MKNIYLPKDNIPKIAEVREIENEIPTYEEFLKTYKQESLNYEDLTHEDISSVKGYGPCNWNNPRCSCRCGERWVDLKIPCPGGCDDSTLINFTHSVCGDNFEISNQARIQCKGCGVVDNLVNFRFSCSNHNHRGNYMSVERTTEHNSFIRSLLIAKRNNEIKEDFFTELLQCLENGQ